MLIYPENEWNIYDEDGTMLPWYTVPSLNWIKNNLSNDLSVLEIGGGNSTLWWRKNARSVHTIECNEYCANQLGCSICDPFEIANTIDDLKESFDVVIVDGGGERGDYILNAFQVCDNFFIVDNWQQSEVCVYNDEIVAYLYNNTKQQLVFKQENHKDWKTAIFIKK